MKGESLMKKSYLFLLAMILASSIFLFPSIGFACSCADLQPVEEELASSKAVFTGSVIEINEVLQPNGTMKRDVLFEVEQSWKGINQSQVMITTGSGGGDCGYDFEQGQKYLVYASNSSMYGNDNDLITNICSRTNEISLAQEDLSILGEGAPPSEQMELTSDTSASNTYLWIISIIVLVTLSFFVFRRLKQ